MPSLSFRLFVVLALSRASADNSHGDAKRDDPIDINVEVANDAGELGKQVCSAAKEEARRMPAMLRANAESALEVGKNAMGALSEECLLAPEVCGAVVVGAGVITLIGFAVERYNQQQAMQTNAICNIFRSDVGEMEDMLNEMFEGMKRWKPKIDQKAYGDLPVEFSNQLDLGQQFVEATNRAITDAHSLKVGDSSTTARAANPYIPVLIASLVIPGIFAESSASFRIVPSVVIATTLHGCGPGDTGGCPTDEELHPELIRIEDDMELALKYIQNLQDCVPNGKPVCSSTELKNQVQSVHYWLNGCSSHMNVVQRMLNEAASGEQMLALGKAANIAVVPTKEPRDFMLLSSRAESKARLLRERISSGLRSNCTSMSCILCLVAAVGLCALLLLRRQLRQGGEEANDYKLVDPGEEANDYNKLVDRVNLQKNLSTFARRQMTTTSSFTVNTKGTGRSVLVRLFKTLGSLCIVACLLFLLWKTWYACTEVADTERVAADVILLDTLASGSKDIQNKLQLQDECGACSQEEKDHLLSQLASIVSDAFAKFERNGLYEHYVATPEEAIQRNLESFQKCRTLRTCSAEEKRRLIRTIINVAYDTFTTLVDLPASDGR